MGKVMQVASFSLAEVTYITGDIGYQVQESVKNAQFRVRAKQENVSGVMLPVFESYQEGANGKKYRSILKWQREKTVSTADVIWCLSDFYSFRHAKKEKLTDFTLMYIANELTGLGRGGQQVQKCKDTYIKAVETLVELASLQVK